MPKKPEENERTSKSKVKGNRKDGTIILEKEEFFERVKQDGHLHINTKE